MFVTRDGTKFSARLNPKPHKKQWNPDNFNAPFVDIGELVIELTSQPLGSHSAYNYKREYLSQMVLSKYVGSETSPADVRVANAINKMLDSERTCQRINNFGYEDHILPYWFNGVMHYAKEFTASVLGTFSYDIFERAKFSAGASTSRRKRHGDPFFKYAGYDRLRKMAPLDVTPDCLPFGVALIRATPLWSVGCNGQMPNITTGNRITTVPKATSIDRCIAMEPDLNMALQLSVGGYIRRRLKFIGIDLNDQSVNQKLAKVGSIDGSLATIDLSSASDSISHRLVMDLLPWQWYDILDKLRSKSGVLPDGTSIKWEKFSSMGNGFTFELETLLFASLLHGVSRMSDKHPNWGIDSIVYGDDIILPSQLATNLIGVLACVGFKTNADKTFVSGPFRESCGKHYYEGVDVSPFYIRGDIVTMYDICRLCNRIRQWSYDETTDMLDSSVWPIWKRLIKSVPRRLYGGINLDRTDYVVTTHKQRDRLMTQYKSVSINGYSAILRWFQSAYDIAESNPSFYYAKCNDTTGTKLALSTVVRIDYKANDELWQQIARFSEEIP